MHSVLHAQFAVGLGLALGFRGLLGVTGCGGSSGVRNVSTTSPWQR